MQTSPQRHAPTLQRNIFAKTKSPQNYRRWEESVLCLWALRWFIHASNRYFAILLQHEVIMENPSSESCLELSIYINLAYLDYNPVHAWRGGMGMCFSVTIAEPLKLMIFLSTIRLYPYLCFASLVSNCQSPARRATLLKVAGDTATPFLPTRPS